MFLDHLLLNTPHHWMLSVQHDFTNNVSDLTSLQKTSQKKQKQKTHPAEHAEHTHHMNNHKLPVTFSFHVIICMKRIMGR
jgi:hypothetical protein